MTTFRFTSALRRLRFCKKMGEQLYEYKIIQGSDVWGVQNQIDSLTRQGFTVNSFDTLVLQGQYNITITVLLEKYVGQ
jgi:hypothetical protein